MKRPLTLTALLVASLGLFACAVEEEDAAQSNDPLTRDIRSMIVNADGTYTVTCKDGTVEKGVTAEEIEASAVCNGPDAGDDDAGVDADVEVDAAIDASLDAKPDASDASKDASKDATGDVRDASDASKDAAKDVSIDI